MSGPGEHTGRTGGRTAAPDSRQLRERTDLFTAAPTSAPAAPTSAPATPTSAPAAPTSTTAHDLTLRRRLLLTLSALLTLALFASYQGVHADAGPLRTSSAPAVLALDTALYALDQAQARATGSPPSFSEFQRQVSVAAQSVSRAAAGDAGGAAGRQAVQTVAGLITGYTGMVQKAQVEPEGSLLREAYLSYATTILKSEDSGIEARLREWQREQLVAVDRQTAFGPLLLAGWSTTALLAVALAAGLAETQLFLRRRFRRRYNRGLLAAAVVLAAGFAVVLLFTVWTYRGMADTRALLDAAPPGPAVPEAGRRTAGYLAHTGFRAAAAGWIPLGGLLLMALSDAGLRPHIAEYRFRPR
ncbi:hypothetical protein KUM39_15255 [Streptomyces sp. J2-1]|uniref:hypothetical protein n=1 Tax=Streptomyces corallincola TaxID=2851888 RepID=UPI001C3806CE|nr:hypothetical protein [Streptomyces corallincola]MBV2355715.1 hypothetical protein [Streptomyces corallincola]